MFKLVLKKAYDRNRVMLLSWEPTHGNRLHDLSFKWCTVNDGANKK